MGSFWVPYLIFQGVSDEVLPSNVVIILNHYQDPYSTTSILESIGGFFRGSHGLLGFDWVPMSWILWAMGLVSTMTGTELVMNDGQPLRLRLSLMFLARW